MCVALCVTVCTARFNTQQFSMFCLHSVLMWIWEQTAIISLYSINWLVGFYNWDGVCLLRGTFYILRSVHTVYLCVLRGSENKQRLFHCTALTGWFLQLRRSVFTARYVLHSTFCPHSVFMCSVWIWEQTAIISLYSIGWLVFITRDGVFTARYGLGFYI